MLPTRRSVLLVGVASALTACSRGAARPAAAIDPDVALTQSAVARERALLAAYDEAVVALPALATRLVPLRAEHAAHLAALLSPPVSGSPSPSGPPTQLPVSAATATSAAATLARLADLERAAATAHTSGAVVASRRLAPLLASLAASEASHVVVL